jgi:hypothetical protein
MQCVVAKSEAAGARRGFTGIAISVISGAEMLAFDGVKSGGGQLRSMSVATDADLQAVS